jgi:uncharacterized YccA/Bax inhibitor family protein
VALGGISVVFEARYPGIVSQAVFLTFGTLGALLVAYRSGVIRATENFKLGVVAATGGIALLYLLSFVLGFFGVSVPLIHSSGTFGILFSVFVVVIAALNLVLDFDFIEQGVDRGAPKHMEWYGAFGLLVTLVWLTWKSCICWRSCSLDSARNSIRAGSSHNCSVRRCNSSESMAFGTPEAP